MIYKTLLREHKKGFYLMKKICLIMLLVVFAIILSSCGKGDGRFQELYSIDRAVFGADVFLDTKSVTYNSSNDTATCWMKAEYDEKTVKRFGYKYTLFLLEMKIKSRKYRVVEYKDMDENDKVLQKNTGGSPNSILSKGEPEEIYEAVTKILRNQGKISQ